MDLISDSTFYPVPLDHGDGKGPLGAAAAELTAKVPYFYAVGNMSTCSSTDRALYRTVYSDGDGTRGHDFDLQATDKVDRNTLAIEVEGSTPCNILVVLEWDSWPWQVKEDPEKPWTKEEIIRVQDIDMVLYRQAPTGAISVVGKSDINQFARGGIPPVEYVYLEEAQPGTYLIQVANVSDMHDIPGVFTRAVEFNVLVYLLGEGEMTIEHCTREGTVFNIAAAESVVCVGAVGWTGTEWCVMPFSSQGPTSDGRVKPELVAPNGYLSQVLNGPFGGTSASAPVVAGGAALLLQAKPSLSPQELAQALIQGTTKLCGTSCNGPCLSLNPYNYAVGWGMLILLK
ncbi:MAG: S8 family serine peptidase, partial [Clostridia bacterium]|nr:S8 family serine peptidase [Clostridia bacterium]